MVYILKFPGSTQPRKDLGIYTLKNMKTAIDYEKTSKTYVDFIRGASTG